MNRLKIKNLQKTYKNGVTATNNISLDITNGMFGLLGPNGAGKSSLMKTIAGLQSPDSGSILFNNVDIIKDPSFIKKQLGFLPQDFGVYPKINATDLLNHIAILKGLTNKNERKEQVNILLEKVNLTSHRNKEVHTFSGGMRQRFGIAQALLGNPQLIIVDEPTAGLDPEERNRFNNLLNEIGEDIIIILSTHLVEDVKNLCTQMAIIEKGTVLAQGKPNDFIEVLNGQLWQKTIDKKEILEYEQKHDVILTQLNMGKSTIHVRAKNKPDDSFELIRPNLEDVYFSILNQNK
ncbi:multidrug ABC transporter ATPase [Flavobacterium sp. 316]|uniref:ABC transporter ATP-binding protein n=1 Tax=Flavobacterium sp. 316 TaxID=1603293 RepID=UPI0005E27FEC|nr:ABC transporter ATP-binding protein [Flavobacterium sp. 316]KIX21413.1 multidrug ABC transporter ATPase [Flavobacterium sp. 316]